MIKAFLSHSSKDKEAYVKSVALRLGVDNITYDEFTFEEGEVTLTQILSQLDKTAIFVLFLSDSALNSQWVQMELSQAKDRLDSEQISKIYPIVIDKSIKYNDPRIPEWLRENYNIKFIGRSTVAARRIQQKLREASWKKHPKLEVRYSIFVGRNNLLDEFEQRIHDFDSEKPKALFVSGINGIGRRTFLKHALSKTNIIEKSFKPNSIYVDVNVSIEDFILKLNDIGLVELGDSLLSLGDKSMEEKKSIVKKILKAAYDYKEVIFILDNGCLINYQREVTGWFREIIDSQSDFQFPVLCIASKYRVYFENKPRNDNFFFMEISELTPSERRRLLTQFLDLYEIDMSKNEFESVSERLNGFPEQVGFSVDLFRHEGLNNFNNKLHLISRFNTDRAAVLFQKYAENEKIVDLIMLLAQFEVITLEYIYTIINADEYQEIINELVSENICEFLGAEKEMVRLNDIVRDYVTRNNYTLKRSHKEKVKKTVVNFIKSDEMLELDSSRYIFSIKEALKLNLEVDEKFIIPSHYLRCIKDLYYSKGSSDRIIHLAELILQKERNLDYRLINDIRYYLCLSLAKKKNKRFMAEVNKITGDEHDFLMGFYYRQAGRLNEALQRFNKIKDAKYVSARAKRELVQVYIQMEDYENALKFAKQNFEDNKGNQFHAQAYFQCLIYSHNPSQHTSKLQELIDTLIRIDSTQSKEMAEIAKAIFIAKIEEDEIAAFDQINDTIDQYPDNHYPLLTKCDIAVKFKNVSLLEEAVNSLEKISNKKQLSNRTFLKYKSYLLAFKGKEEDAIKIIQQELQKYPHENKQKIINKIKEYSQIGANKMSN